MQAPPAPPAQQVLHLAGAVPALRGNPPERPSPAPLAVLGSHVLQAWLAGATPEFDLLTGADALAAASELHRNLELDDAVALVASQLTATSDLQADSATRMLRDIAQFVERLRLLKIPSLAEVTREQVEDFLDEAVEDRSGVFSNPSISTQHFRRSSVRLLYRTARQLHLVDGDPTLDIRLPPRASSPKRPLEDDEELLARGASRQTLDATRLPAAWAIGQAAATATELATATIDDVDLGEQRIRLSGSRDRAPRWARLTPWGVEQVAARIEALRHGDDRRLVYNGKRGTDARGGWCNAITEVLRLAGLSDEAGLGPASLAAWAGRREFDRTGKIEDAARTLGMRSLDNAAGTIGWDWHAT